MSVQARKPEKHWGILKRVRVKHMRSESPVGKDRRWTHLNSNGVKGQENGRELATTKMYEKVIHKLLTMHAN